MHSRTETIDSPSGPMGIHPVRPDGDGPFPVVLFFHHGPRVDQGSNDTMAKIAEWGYSLDKGEAEIHDGTDHGFGVMGPSQPQAAGDRSYKRTRVMVDRELL